MSYLIGPRLHFAGNFTADVSTVNNIPTHFKNPNQPASQGWNPSGTGSWSITSCTVKGAVFADGTVARSAADDPVVGVSLLQDGRARLVDLDSEQQMVSQIWGMQLHLASPGGAPAFAGKFKTAPFSDLWTGRLPTTGQIFDRNMCAFYQSVLTDVAWSDLFNSRVLADLKAASASGLLSIKFNVDGFDQQQHVGRIVGTIGPALANEPAHFVVGRQCMGNDAGPVWYFPAIVDTNRGKLIADFGNALQTTSFRGPFNSSLNLQIGLVSENQFTSLGQIPIGPDGWYEQTAGVCEFPSGRKLSADEIQQLETTPIGVVQQTSSGLSLVASEGADGMHVRADDFVYRMSANDTKSVTLYASRFGKPLPNAQITITLDPSQLQGGSGVLAVGEPIAGVGFPGSIPANAQGNASLLLTAGSIKTPRDYIDGQVYGVRYALAQSDPNAGGYFNSSDFVSVLVWTDYTIPSDPTWNDHVEPILREYRNLYPVMRGFVDLGSYDDVTGQKAVMQSVFNRPQEDPRYMPVTRDLSPAKRQMILNWLQTTGNAGQPNLGAQPLVAAAPASPLATEAAQPEEDLVTKLGGKSAALQRRMGGAGQPRGFAKRSLE